MDDEFSDLNSAPTVQEIDIYQNMDDDLIEEMGERQLEQD